MYIETPDKELINLNTTSKIVLEELSHGGINGVFVVFYGIDGKTRIASIEFKSKEDAKKWMVKQVYAAALKNR